MRTTGNVLQVNGTALVTETFIDVNAYWLILPLIAILLASFFLAAVIIQSKMYDIPAWKSSQLQTISLLEPDSRQIRKKV